MKIVISATGPTMDSEVDPRFGRCRYFIIVDPETMRFEAVDNASAAASGGAGISAAQAVVGKGIDVVLTGDCGPKAYQALTAAGIKVVTGASRKVQDVIAGYKQGDYTTFPGRSNWWLRRPAAGLSSDPQTTQQWRNASWQ